MLWGGLCWLLFSICQCVVVEEVELVKGTGNDRRGGKAPADGSIDRPRESLSFILRLLWCSFVHSGNLSDSLFDIHSLSSPFVPPFLTSHCLPGAITTRICCEYKMAATCRVQPRCLFVPPPFSLSSPEARASCIFAATEVGQPRRKQVYLIFDGCTVNSWALLLCVLRFQLKPDLWVW